MYQAAQTHPLSLFRGIGHQLVLEFAAEDGSALDLSDRTFSAKIGLSPGGTEIAEFEVDASELATANRLTLTLAADWADDLDAAETEASWDLLATPASGPREIWILPSLVSIAACGAAAGGS
jgi:hypothetical protein